MSAQHTLLTSHKGVDLHAATAVRVMQRRLDGGDALAALARCEFHTVWEGPDVPTVAALLAVGRYFNPNKHHFGHFRATNGGQSWFVAPPAPGGKLPSGWPGEAVDASTRPAPADLYDTLLGGPAPAGCVAVDVVSYPLGERGPVLSGVLWRLTLRDDGRDPLRLAERLAVARGGTQGLLINPHAEGWLMAAADVVLRRCA